MYKWCFELTCVAEMTKGVSADGEGERPRTELEARDGEGDPVGPHSKPLSPLPSL